MHNMPSNVGRGAKKELSTFSVPVECVDHAPVAVFLFEIPVMRPRDELPFRSSVSPKLSGIISITRLPNIVSCRVSGTTGIPLCPCASCARRLARHSTAGSPLTTHWKFQVRAGLTIGASLMRSGVTLLASTAARTSGLPCSFLDTPVEACHAQKSDFYLSRCSSCFQSVRSAFPIWQKTLQMSTLSATNFENFLVSSLDWSAEVGISCFPSVQSNSLLSPSRCTCLGVKPKEIFQRKSPVAGAFQLYTDFTAF